MERVEINTASEANAIEAEIVNREGIDSMNAVHVRSELSKARRKFQDFRSAAEGFGVIDEEYRELADAIRENDYIKIRKEATQLCAMSLRFMTDIHMDNFTLRRADHGR